MDAIFALLATVSAIARAVVLGVAVLLAVVALVDWAVRTRRLNPFGPVARFFRRSVDPLLLPVERRVVRMGGRPADAPLWVLGLAVVGGLVLLALLDFVGEELARSYFALQGGTRGVLLLLALWTFGLLRLALLVRVLSSWLPVSPTSRWIRWSFVLTEWMLGPLRRVIPTLGPVDITPILAYFGLVLLQSAVL